jgi:hypothetical protein
MVENPGISDPGASPYTVGGADTLFDRGGTTLQRL